MSFISFSSISSLRLYATTPSAGDIAEVTGYYTAGDGGGGEFFWDASSGASDNGGTIIKQASAAMGRWIRAYSTPIDVRWFGAKGDNIADDTTYINNALGIVSTGEVVFGQNGIYQITGTLTVSNPITINLNGATVQFASSVSTIINLPAFTISSDNVTIKNGIIRGTYSPGDNIMLGMGPYGVRNSPGKANLSLDRLTITNVQSYGALSVNGANPSITNCKFISTGYICLYCNNSSAVEGGLIDGNIFDRSALPPGPAPVPPPIITPISQPCVAIRGSSTGPVYTTDLVFTNNKVISVLSPDPTNPLATAAEGIELRYVNHALVANNIFINGIIGASVIFCSYSTISGNTCSGCSIEGIELGSGSYNVVDGNTIDGGGLSNTVGILVDGTTPSGPFATYNTLSNNAITNVTAYGIQIVRGCGNNSIIGGTISQGSGNKACIIVQGAQSTLISKVIMDGQSNATGNWGILLDNTTISSGAGFIINGAVIDGCSFNNFNSSASSSAIRVIAPNGGTITGLRFTNNVLDAGSLLSTSLMSGATISAPYYFGNAAGSNASAGAATLVAGTVTIANTLVTSSSLIFLTVSTPGGTRGFLSYNKIAGTSFTINSTSATETSTVTWLILD